MDRIKGALWGKLMHEMQLIASCMTLSNTARALLSLAGVHEKTSAPPLELNCSSR